MNSFIMRNRGWKGEEEEKRSIEKAEDHLRIRFNYKYVDDEIKKRKNKELTEKSCIFCWDRGGKIKNKKQKKCVTSQYRLEQECSRKRSPKNSCQRWEDLWRKIGKLRGV